MPQRARLPNSGRSLGQTDAFMHRVKELDDFAEKRMKLGKRGKDPNPLKKQQEDSQGKGKGAGKKGKNKSNQTSAQEENESGGNPANQY